jgi:hypothetical protein
LEELLVALDETFKTYECILKDNYNANWENIRRLFQCIAMGIPLRDEDSELAEFLAFDFDGHCESIE